MRVSGINLSSKNPKRLAEFYLKMGLAIYVDGDNFDGWNLGQKEDENRINIWIWDENKWETSQEGFVTIVLSTEDIESEYTRLKLIIPEINPPIKASWGGTELKLEDPDGNHILVI